MPSLSARSVIVVLVAAIGGGLAIAQTSRTGSDIAEFRCGDISLLPVANQAALIYYIAGYRDGAAAASSAPISDTPPERAPVLNLDARRIVAACADAPESSIAELIAADKGGSGGTGSLEASLGLEASSSSMEPGRIIVLRDRPDTSATDAVSSNLEAASEQLQRSLDRPPLGAAPAP